MCTWNKKKLNLPASLKRQSQIILHEILWFLCSCYRSAGMGTFRQRRTEEQTSDAPDLTPVSRGSNAPLISYRHSYPRETRSGNTQLPSGRHARQVDVCCSAHTQTPRRSKMLASRFGEPPGPSFPKREEGIVSLHASWHRPSVQQSQVSLTVLSASSRPCHCGNILCFLLQHSCSALLYMLDRALQFLLVTEPISVFGSWIIHSYDHSCISKIRLLRQINN